MPELSVALQSVPDPVPITSGAAPIDVDPHVLSYVVTTGGTGEEIINLPIFEDEEVFVMVGRRLGISLLTQTDGGDELNVTVAGSGSINIYPSQKLHNAKAQRISGGVKLTFEGAYAVFVWDGVDWLLDWALYGDSSTLSAEAINITGEDGATGAAVVLNAGSSTAEDVAGGAVSLSAGHANDGDADGGDILLTPGSGAGTGRGGVIKAFNLPTADPTVFGALWNSSGTLKISAG